VTFQIYNLACPASPPHYQYNAIKTMKTSFLGAMNLLGLAKRVNARILQASTSEVYGDPNISPQVWIHCVDTSRKCLTKPNCSLKNTGETSTLSEFGRATVVCLLFCFLLL
jgi:nucleoside-diphosphate-sugar epimerase